jgi:hypothetical protein
MPETAFCPEWNTIVQKHVRPPRLSVTDGLADPVELIVPSLSMILVSSFAVTVIAEASFVLPVPFTLTATVCAPDGTPDSSTYA